MKYCLKYFQTTSNAPANKLSNLDGFRGLLALTVIFQHSYLLKVIALRKTEYRLFDGLGEFIGVPGFFVLSAFLLTYRLLIDFDRVQNNERLFELKVVQYTVRRFLRIYVTFFIFFTLVYFSPNYYDDFIAHRPEDYLGGITLSPPDGHLWTISVEIKYYCIIPFICFGIIKLGRFWFVLALSLVAMIISIERTYPNELKSPYLRLVNVFFKGSVVAIVYFKLKKLNSNLYKALFENLFSQILFTILLVWSTIHELRLGSKLFNPLLNIKNKHYSSSLLTLILICLIFCKENNFFASFYNTSFLRVFGKYSFSIYLWHFNILYVVRYYGHYFGTYIESLCVSLFLCYILGVAWYYVTENVFMNMASHLCKRIEMISYFHVASSTPLLELKITEGNIK